MYIDIILIFNVFVECVLIVVGVPGRSLGAVVVHPVGTMEFNTRQG